MNIKIRDSVNKNEWNNLLKHDFNVFNTVEWAEFNGNPKYIVVLEGDALVGGMIFREERVLSRKTLISDAAPIAISNYTKLEILNFFKKLSGVKIINSTFQDSRFDDLFTKLHFKPTEKATVIIDLNKNEDTKIFLDKDSRYDINKALKQNVKITDGTKDNSEWENFFKIYNLAGKYWGVKMLTKNEFMKFRELGKFNLAKLFIAKIGDIIASGSIVLNSGNTLIFYINAINPDKKQLQSNSLLVWEIMNYAKKNDFKYFDLFGYDLYAKKNEKTYGINKFKMSFGGEIKKFYKFTDSNMLVIGRKLYNKIRLLKKLYFFLQRFI